MSTIAGLAGRIELLKFAARLGLRQQWLQRIGNEFEHFDVMGWKRIAKAKALGAKEVERRRLMEYVLAKREVKTGSKRKRAYAYAAAVARNSLIERGVAIAA